MAITKVINDIVDLNQTSDYSGLRTPVGTTADITGTSPLQGAIRTNTSESTDGSGSAIEHYNGTEWKYFSAIKYCTTNKLNFPPGAGCIASYNLNNNINDIGGTYDLSNNTATFTASGKFGAAAVFNGSTGSITGPPILSSTYTGSFSVSVWFKTSNTDNNLKTIFVSDDTTGSITGKVVLLSIRDSKLEVVGYNFPLIEGVGTNNVSDGNWHNVVLVLDNSNAKLKVYLDGNSTPEITEDLESSNITLDKVFSEDWQIGAQGTDRFFDGNLDQFRIFTSALTQNQIDEVEGNEVACS